MFKRDPEKMHAIKDDRPDWEGIPDDKLNRWQRIAKKTKGWVTAANGLTILGTVTVINGLADFANGQHAAGTAKVAAGRILDLGDGKLADRQGVKGPVGKRMDVVADMGQLAVALPVLYASDTIPLVPVLAVAAPKAAGAIGSVAAELRNREVNVNSDGKIGTFGIWGGAACFMIAKTLGAGDFAPLADTLEAAGWVGMIGGGALGARASIEYMQAGFGTTPSENKAT